MVYQYLVYTEDGKVAKGTITAEDERAASEALAQRGYRVLTLKPVATKTAGWEKAFSSFSGLSKLKPEMVVMFSRQLALLLESGIDIVTSLDLLREQVTNRSLKKVLGEVAAEVRTGSQLSVALSKHPESFPSIYCRSLGVGEKTGGLETVLKQMADYMDKEIRAGKEVKSALKYPIIVSIVAFVVIGVIVTFVLPAFTGLYDELGVELPLMTRLLLDSVGWFTSYGVYVIGGGLIIVLLAYIYIKTPEGSLAWDRLSLKIPLMGRVRLLDELAHCSRSMSMLFRAGLPLPEIMSLVIESSENRVVKLALTDVQRDMLKGEGLSGPMAKSKLFLPLMVQMVRVGEETGTLDVTLTAVAQNFETEAADKMRSLISYIQPAITLGIGVVVAFIALSLVTAMYSVYGQGL